MARPPARPALLRTLNDRTVVELLLAHGPLTRAEIASLSGLSKPTSGEALTRLLAEGVVGHAGVSSGRPGPSAQAYAVDTRRVLAAAVTVTPKRIVLDVVDVAGQVIGAAEAPRRSTVPPAEAVRLLLHEALPARTRVDALVVSVPGVYDPGADIVRYADGIPEWTRPGLAADLRRLDIAHVTVDNDVNLAAVAERQRGAGRDEQGFALLWIDEGLGLALDTDGALHRGATGVAGEIGYMPVRTDVRDREGRPADFQGLVGGAAVRALAKAHGLRGRSTADLLTAAVTQDADAFLEELAARIAVGIAVIVAVADPAVIVLGGSVGTAGGEALATRVDAATTRVSRLRARVIPSSVGSSPARSGAAHVASRAACDLLIPDLAPPTSTQTSLKETS